MAGSRDLLPHMHKAPPAVYYQLSIFKVWTAMAFTFGKFIVCLKAMLFADQVCGITEEFPRGCGFLSDQLNRAAVSIAANIAEDNGGFTIGDRRNFFTITRRFAHKAVVWLGTDALLDIKLSPFPLLSMRLPSRRKIMSLFAERMTVSEASK